MNVHLLDHVQFSELCTCSVSYIHAFITFTQACMCYSLLCHEVSDIKKKLTSGSGFLFSKTEHYTISAS
jgi:hypothetical protein